MHRKEKKKTRGLRLSSEITLEGALQDILVIIKEAIKVREFFGLSGLFCDGHAVRHVALDLDCNALSLIEHILQRENVEPSVRKSN